MRPRLFVLELEIVHLQNDCLFLSIFNKTFFSTNPITMFVHFNFDVISFFSKFHGLKFDKLIVLFQNSTCDPIGLVSLQVFQQLINPFFQKKTSPSKTFTFYKIRICDKISLFQNFSMISRGWLADGLSCKPGYCSFSTAVCRQGCGHHSQIHWSQPIRCHSDWMQLRFEQRAAASAK